MKRNKPHVIDDKGDLLLRSTLPPNWIVRKIDKDYGVDYEVELVDQELLTGNRIWIQLKTKESTSKKSFVFSEPEDPHNGTPGDESNLGGEFVPCVLKTKYLKYVKGCGIPLLLFVADLQEEEIYWLPLQYEVTRQLTGRNPDWRSQDTVTVRVPIWNRLSHDKRFNYSALRWFSLYPTRCSALLTLLDIHNQLTNEQPLCMVDLLDLESEALEREIESVREYVDRVTTKIKEALEIDVLFGKQGIPFFLTTNIVGHNIPGLVHSVKAIGAQADEAYRELVSGNTCVEKLQLCMHQMMANLHCLQVAAVQYNAFQNNFLFNSATACWYAHGQELDPGSFLSIPLKLDLPE